MQFKYQLIFVLLFLVDPQNQLIFFYCEIRSTKWEIVFAVGKTSKLNAFLSSILVKSV